MSATGLPMDSDPEYSIGAVRGTPSAIHLFSEPPRSEVPGLLRRAPAPTGTPRRSILMATQSPHPQFLLRLTRHARAMQWRLITDMLHTGVIPSRWDGDGIIALASYPSDISHDIDRLERSGFTRPSPMPPRTAPTRD